MMNYLEIVRDTLGGIEHMKQNFGLNVQPLIYFYSIYITWMWLLLPIRVLDWTPAIKKLFMRVVGIFWIREVFYIYNTFYTQYHYIINGVIKSRRRSHSFYLNWRGIRQVSSKHWSYENPWKCKIFVENWASEKNSGYRNSWAISYREKFLSQ